MKYVGYVDPKDLPIKAGDWVVIKKGIWVRTLCKERKTAGKTYKVRVNHILPGMGYPEGHPDREHASLFRKPGEVINPMVVWAGPGGYWTEADINDVEKTDPPSPTAGTPPRPRKELPSGQRSKRGRPRNPSAPT